MFVFIFQFSSCILGNTDTCRFAAGYMFDAYIVSDCVSFFLNGTRSCTYFDGVYYLICVLVSQHAFVPNSFELLVFSYLIIVFSFLFLDPFPLFRSEEPPARVRAKFSSVTTFSRVRLQSARSFFPLNRSPDLADRVPLLPPDPWIILPYPLPIQAGLECGSSKRGLQVCCLFVCAFKNILLQSTISPPVPLVGRLLSDSSAVYQPADLGLDPWAQSTPGAHNWFCHLLHLLLEISLSSLKETISSDLMISAQYEASLIPHGIYYSHLCMADFCGWNLLRQTSPQTQS
ncbi:unnamed protein product [Protopolystoma xenopodis]|uniref:Uncharacterized protein n=1 Tax=Protopolystoma xenopodis TaxID=117903 RepID=A0A448WCJ2_9PLAT|nr:unnamed protein product [Protopolystoma xenopodis]